MDNHARRVAYLVQNLGISREAADRQAMTGYALGTQDAHLTPAQRRRIRHKQGSAHAPARRGPSPQVVITDEAPFTFKAADAMRKMYAALPARGAIGVKQGGSAPVTR